VSSLPSPRTVPGRSKLTPPLKDFQPVVDFHLGVNFFSF